MELTQGRCEALEGSFPSYHRMDEPKIERALRVPDAMGENPEREGLRGTPRRVAAAYEFLFAGLGEDPTRHLGGGFQ